MQSWRWKANQSGELAREGKPERARLIWRWKANQRGELARESKPERVKPRKPTGRGATRGEPKNFRKGGGGAVEAAKRRKFEGPSQAGDGQMSH